MSRAWIGRAWQAAFFVALLGATWALLAPEPPAVGERVPFLDKLLHVLLFAVLALMAAKAYPDKPRWGIAAALVFYGVCVEIAQPRTGRAFEILDILADALGAAAVFLVQQRSSPPAPSAKR